jgi:hypothetical protein
VILVSQLIGVSTMGQETKLWDHLFPFRPNRNEYTSTRGTHNHHDVHKE